MEGKYLLTDLSRKTKKALADLEYYAHLGRTRPKLYGAGRSFDGTSDYFRVFPRDSFTSALLLKDPNFLRNLLFFCSKTQGRKYNPLTGEEPGKIPHEWPGVVVRGRNTLYASVDATLLFLVGLVTYWDWTKDRKFIERIQPSIKRAVGYLFRHIKGDLFWDDPAYCGAKEYALWSGCWRDGGYPERKYREHIYPASYLMVNIFAVNALRGLARLGKEGFMRTPSWSLLMRKAEGIKNTTLKRFWLPHPGYFSSALDRQGLITTLYLDSVWSLYFLEKGDFPKEKIKKTFRSLKRLETPFGYLSRERLPGYDYEGGKKKIGSTIWPYEHAYLAYAAEKFGVGDFAERTLRPLRVLSQGKYPFREYLAFENDKAYARGCHAQLWTIAYVVGESRLFSGRG